VTRLARRLRPFAPALASVLAIVLIPFAIAGRHADALVTQMLASTADRPFAAAAVIAGALAADALLPVPSSLLATGAGYLLGFTRALFTVFVGLSAGSTLGYLVGRTILSAPATADRPVTWAEPAIVLTRPIPVLAETTALLAGTCRFPFRRFMVVSTLSNLCLAAAYAAAGALSAARHAPWIALTAACALPAATLLAIRSRSRMHGGTP